MKLLFKASLGLLLVTPVLAQNDRLMPTPIENDVTRVSNLCPYDYIACSDYCYSIGSLLGFCKGDSKDICQCFTQTVSPRPPSQLWLAEAHRQEDAAKETWQEAKDYLDTLKEKGAGPDELEKAKRTEAVKHDFFRSKRRQRENFDSDWLWKGQPPEPCC